MSEDDHSGFDRTKFSNKEIQRMRQGLPPWSSMSFACGGWLQYYMFGVAKSMQVMGLDKGVDYCGCSAGALTGLGVVLEGDFDAAIAFCKEEIVPMAYGSLFGLFRLNHYVTQCIERVLSPKYREIPEGRLQVSITRLPFFKPERVTKFHSERELLQTVLASAAAFPTAPIVKLGKNWYIDGGLSEFQPVVDEHTIRVSPFYFSECEIRPSRYVPLWWTFIPPWSGDTIDWLYSLGYEDGMNYVKSRGIPTPRLKSREPSPTTSADAEEAKNAPKRGKHAYDNRRRVTIHRFLGYDLANMSTTNQLINFLFDLYLLFLLLVVFKPMALFLIYFELAMRTVLLCVRLWCYILYAASPLNFVINFCDRLVCLLIGNKVLAHRFTMTEKKLAEARRDLSECMACLFSLSLLLRFLSGRPSAVTLRKHSKLARLSLLYRIFRHMI